MSNTPVAYPISELIAQDVVETLRAVAIASGYLNDLDVEVVTQGGAPPLRDGLTVVGIGKPETSPNPPLGLDEYMLTFGVYSCVIESEASDPAVLRGRLGSVAADIRRALMVDRHRGNRAVNTEFDADEIHHEASPPHVIVWPKVTFRTLLNDPYRR